jgi:hypothetical protein|tara:strand:+ start:6177 stop:7010 length:834 start_codon:yes stop_codon:yes gene_type:complete
MESSKKTNIFEIKNYNKTLTISNDIILSKFCELINEYLFHITENIIIQNRQYYIFILLRGLSTIKHIFNTMLLYTKNLDLTIYHTKKAYLFYVEFIGQIGEENNSYLQLNSKDATLFVYKKTIFEINNEYRKQFILNKDEKERFKLFDIFSKLVVEMFETVIYNENFKGETRMSYMMYIQKMTNKAVNKIIIMDKNVKDKIDICEKYLYYKNLLQNKCINIDECLFFNLSNLFLKKIQNSRDTSINDINKKMYHKNCNEKIVNETPLKFTNWLFNGK